MSSRKIRSPVASDGGFKSRFRWLLEYCGLSQSEAARRLGIKQGVISGWLSGRHKPSASTRSLICAVFGLNEQWLMTGSGEIYNERGGQGGAAEAPEPYGDLEWNDRRTLNEIADLLRDADPQTKEDLKYEINKIQRLAKIPKKRA